MRYESNLPDCKRRAYRLLSGVGCAVLLIGLALYMASGADGLETIILSITFLLTALATLFVLIGIIVRITQLIRKIDRVLTGRQLVTGFSFVLFGSLAAAVCTLIAVVIDLIFRYEHGACFIAQGVMCVGGWLCFLSALPLWRSYKNTP